MQILSLRRLAEAEAQAGMRLLRGELELAQAQAERAQRELGVAELALAQGRAAQRQRGISATPAAQLDRESAGLLRKAEAVRRRRVELERATAEVSSRLERLELQRARLLSCVARREAAELHEALERREERRQRAQRERSHDDEARDRFALSRVK